VNVTFAFDKAVLTADDKAQLDELASSLQSARGYILELTGGTDSIGDANYNYQLSQRRADSCSQLPAVEVQYPPHKFYLVGIGKDQQVADDKTREGRAQNRRVRSSCSPTAAMRAAPLLPIGLPTASNNPRYSWSN